MHNLHRQMDWKRLTVEPHKVPRRCHSRDIYGELQPMHDDTSRPLWAWAIVAAGACLALYVTLNGGSF